LCFIFDAPYDAPLEPGVYTGANRYPFEDPGTPGFDIGVDSEGFDELTAQFTILELVYGGEGTIQKFGATFEMFNEQSNVVSFSGDIYYNYDGPLSTPEPATSQLLLIGTLLLGALFFLRSTPHRPGT
jgi:hypothetical protein